MAAVTVTVTSTAATSTTKDTSFFHPLTTIFTPPATCLQAPFSLYTSTSDLIGFSSAWRDRNETSSSCYPYSFSTLQFYWTFYSPGVCPSGYTKAQTRITSSRTSAWCCPTGMTISASGIYQFCSSFIQTPTQAIAGSTMLSDGNLTGLYTVQNTASFIALQWPLSVAWEESDLTLFTPASAPILTSTSSSVSVSVSVSTTNVSSPTITATQVASSDLSTGAKAGIGVGAGIAALLIIAGMILLCVRRRRRREEPIPMHTDYKPQYLAAHSPPAYELDGNSRSKYELDATSRPSELASPVATKYPDGTMAGLQ